MEVSVQYKSKWAVVLTKGLNLSPFAMYFIRTKQIDELFGIIGGLLYAKVGLL